MPSLPCPLPPADLYYLAHGFPVHRLRISDLQKILNAHEVIPKLALTSKPSYIQAFTEYIAGDRGGILRTRAQQGETSGLVNEGPGKDWVESVGHDTDDSETDSSILSSCARAPENDFTAALLPANFYYLAPGFPPGILTKVEIHEILQDHDVRGVGKCRHKDDLVRLFEECVEGIRAEVLRRRKEGTIAGCDTVVDLSAGGKEEVEVPARGSDGDGDGDINVDVGEDADDDDSDTNEESELDAAYPRTSTRSSRRNSPNASSQGTEAKGKGKDPESNGPSTSSSFDTYRTRNHTQSGNTERRGKDEAGTSPKSMKAQKDSTNGGPNLAKSNDSSSIPSSPSQTFTSDNPITEDRGGTSNNNISLAGHLKTLNDKIEALQTYVHTLERAKHIQSQVLEDRVSLLEILAFGNTKGKDLGLGSDRKEDR